jgi:hypothetical protein
MIFDMMESENARKVRVVQAHLATGLAARLGLMASTSIGIT